MLDGVRGEVDLQGGGVRIGPVAVGTLIGLVLVVLALVRLGEHSRGQEARRAPQPHPLLMLPCAGKAAVHSPGGWRAE